MGEPPPSSLLAALRASSCTLPSSRPSVLAFTSSRSKLASWVMNPWLGAAAGLASPMALRASSRVHPSVAMTYAAQMVALRLLPAKQCTSTLPPSNRHLAMNLRHRSKWTHSRSSGTSLTSTHSYVNSEGNLGSKPPATVRTWVMFRRLRTSRLCAAPMEPRNTSGTTSDGSLSDLTFLAVSRHLTRLRIFLTRSPWAAMSSWSFISQAPRFLSSRMVSGSACAR
mmetsp:Transcript_7800/g.35404  ORF Transcript_7800/g.35404 Transcript_7800/m.35404 type:complete len:225 (+) Transcript_7800:167-841(+)